MNVSFSPRRILQVGALTFAWCGLWGAMSAANILSGLTISTIVMMSGIGSPGQGGIKFIPLIHLSWVVFVDLVTSTIDVAIEILTPADRTEEGIVAVPLPNNGRQNLLLLTVAITLTPGTAVVDADPETGTLYLHLLHIDRLESTIAHVEKLANLANDALPVVAPELGASQ